MSESSSTTSPIPADATTSQVVASATPSTSLFGPIFVFTLMLVSIIGDFILIGIGRVTWEQGLPVITIILGIVAALAQPFEKK